MNQTDYDERLDACARALYEKESNMAVTVTADVDEFGERQSWSTLAVDTESMPEEADGRIQIYLLSHLIQTFARGLSIPPEEVTSIALEILEEEHQRPLSWEYNGLWGDIK